MAYEEDEDSHTDCCRTELDSHADSSVVGDNAFIIKSLNMYVTASDFSNALGK